MYHCLTMCIHEYIEYRIIAVDKIRHSVEVKWPISELSYLFEFSRFNREFNYLKVINIYNKQCVG